jgi:dipeptidyl aminopeptidase/acylaminoacyl peptidase
MSKRILIRVAASAVLLATAMSALAQSPAERDGTIPLRDFFRNPERAYFRISPDGRHLSFMQPWERRRNIYVQAIGGTGEPTRITAEKDRDISNYFWKGPDRLVYLKDIGGDENDHVVVASRDGKMLTDMTPFAGVRAEIIDDLREFPDAMLVGLNRRVKEVFDAYRLNLVTGDLTLLVENPGNITAWINDHTGTIRGAIATDGVNQTYLYRDASGAFKPVLTTSFRDAFEPQVFSGDNTRLYALSNLGRDRKALVIVDPATAKEESVVFAHPVVDLGGVGYSYKRKRVTHAQYVTWRTERRYLDDETEQLFLALEARLPGYEISVQGITDDEDRVIVAATSDRTGGTRYLYERSADRLTKLGDVAPWLPEAQMARQQPIVYKARDGLDIQGYLTLPNNREAKNLPLVVNPHGGPWARDVWGFNPEVQFLANRGYAVLQMNYRGSTGYGRKFWTASFKQWGKAMQDDITDGVRHLVAQGIVDPTRVCIYGGSYGGYATLAALAFTPEVYACGVDYVGVSNLFTFMKTIPPYWKPYLEMMYAMVGDPEKDKALLSAASPVMHVERIRAPLLVAQGARDPRVNIDESNQMVKALRARGIDVPYIVKENEGHGFANEENRFEFYEAMERFLARHLR